MHLPGQPRNAPIDRFHITLHAAKQAARIPLLLIGLVFGGGIGFVIAASNGVTLDGHDHATDHGAATHDTMAHHDHSASVDVTGTAPTLNVSLLPDPASGWNLHLDVTNFQFAPERASLAPVEGEGHAHIYANGTKLARIYGPWYHIGALPEGNVDIRVALYSNDHKALMVDGQLISQSLTVNVP